MANQEVQAAPRWFVPVAAIALLWNLLGCAALTMDALAVGPPLTDAQLAYASTVPLWAKAASWTAVGAGVAGSILLLWRKASTIFGFAVSLIAVLIQDLWMFILSDAQAVFGSSPLVMQAGVAAIAMVLLWLANQARTRGWIS